ncbi:MAG: Glyoxalase/Bleomycin resistance protein/Dioxygenase superfamily [Chloroflexi bacterium]|nr:Glyoxalase/Bleomycin resistance protein/Dioxygenase superfamily [Chloroflexota bacterium]
MPLARISHVGFNVASDVFDREFEFWEKVMGLQFVHGGSSSRGGKRVAFFTADPLRDHELILYEVDGPVAAFGDPGCQVEHFAFDCATDAEVDEYTARLRAHGFDVEEPGRGRRQNKVTSPSGIHFEINTPPYRDPKTAARD